ncbi:DUF2914 domain-containing protein [Pseudoalteromonas denitrificans]|uniref:DUF2914 domain-containing protein n=1 Tax=Pseudoalteromonas denitrificans DSM 6059 TaxID=1123010 RepID=A0A1I1SGI9_9GAMM|nr:DUF2914 domain-containing protein [Pseudoalteromonas denitrificans]SFD45566.1 Protein of unknown function [Pseudoalteromonas denitrificans DSM 6059]
MSQRIVIKTKLEHSTHAVDDHIEYQWHWHRILLVSLSLVFIIIVVLWRNFPVVSATESKRAVDKDKQEKVILLKESLGKELAKNTHEIKKLKENELKETGSVIVKSELIKTEKLNNAANVIQKNSKKTELKEQDNTPAEIDKSHLSQISVGGLIDPQFVSRALLTSSVVNREPVDVLSGQIFQSQIDNQLFFFTELNKLQSQKVWHRWYFKNKLMAEVELKIYNTRYRTYSSKKIMATQVGSWRVELVNSKHNILASKSFHIE